MTVGSLTPCLYLVKIASVFYEILLFHDPLSLYASIKMWINNIILTLRSSRLQFLCSSIQFHHISIQFHRSSIQFHHISIQFHHISIQFHRSSIQFLCSLTWLHYNCIFRTVLNSVSHVFFYIYIHSLKESCFYTLYSEILIIVILSSL